MYIRKGKKTELKVILFLLIILLALKLSRFSKIIKQVGRALKPIMLAQILKYDVKIDMLAYRLCYEFNIIIVV